MTDSQDRLRTEHNVVETPDGDAVLIVRAYEEQQFRAFEDGEPMTAEVLKREMKFDAENTDLISKIGHELLTHCAEMSNTGPPGQKPMHQQYAEMEPDP